MGSFGFQELLVIFLIVILLFGATRLPQIGKGLGEGIRNFKKGLRGDEPERLDERKRDA
jgi:sec-independent protein translocase protein TatA